MSSSIPIVRRSSTIELNEQVFEWVPERDEKDYNIDGAIRDISWLESRQRCSRMHDKGAASSNGMVS